MTYLTIWHYLVIFIIILIFIAGIIVSLKQKRNVILPMIFSITLISFVMAILMMFVVDKYTKHVELYRLKHKRLLNLEKVIYSGVIKNTGKYTIGKVTFDLKLISRGKISSFESRSFFKSSGFFEMFSSVKKEKKGSNTLEKSFVVAKNLKPGQVKSFRVYFKYPSYFRNVSEHAKVYGH